MEKLYCHTSLTMDGEVVLTEGEGYFIMDENEYSFVIRNDQGTIHTFTKDPDDDGDSFATWFSTANSSTEETFYVCVDDSNVDILDWIDSHFANENWDKHFQVKVEMKEYEYDQDGNIVFV